jgi:hypothetical protein
MESVLCQPMAVSIAVKAFIPRFLQVTRLPLVLQWLMPVSTDLKLPDNFKRSSREP